MYVTANRQRSTAVPPRRERRWLPAGLMALLLGVACADARVLARRGAATSGAAVQTRQPARQTPTPSRSTPTTPPATILDDTRWVLTGYGTTERTLTPVERGKVTASFKDGEVRGVAGCNQYSGTYSVDGARWTTADIKQTLMACADKRVMDLEATYLEALRTATAFVFKGDSLRLTFARGVLRFERDAR